MTTLRILFVLCGFAVVMVARAGELAAKLDAKLEAAMTEHHIPGLAIAIVAEDRVAYSRTFGVADIETRAPLTSRSVFHLASVTKTFVGTALMQLEEQGRLKLDDRVVEHVPYFKLADARYRDITVGQMASHLSGMPDFDSDPWNNPAFDEGALERFVREFVSTKHLTADPGTRYEYCNTTYEVLGDVIAKASGVSFEEFVARHVLRPLRMRDSTLLLAEVDRTRLVSPHRLENGRLTVSRVFPYNRMHAPSSTMLSTLDDMVRYVRAYLRGGELDGARILSAASVARMAEPAAGRFENVGVSWHLDEVAGRKVVQHSGSDVGFKNFVALVPDAGVGLVLLTNSIETPYRELAPEILAAALAQLD